MPKAPRTIKLIVYDFDGVMTDNKVLLLEDGTEAVVVNRSDGLAVGLIKKMGIRQVIVSTEVNRVVSARAKKLKIPCIQAVHDKLHAVKSCLKEHGIDKRHVAFVGNDINDREAMLYVGWQVVPSDAHSDIKKLARTVLKAKGGCGVVRELYDLLKEHHHEKE